MFSGKHRYLYNVLFIAFFRGPQLSGSYSKLSSTQKRLGITVQDFFNFETIFCGIVITLAKITLNTSSASARVPTPSLTEKMRVVASDPSLCFGQELYKVRQLN